MNIFVILLSCTLLASTFVEADLPVESIEKAAAEEVEEKAGDVVLKTGSEISETGLEEADKVKRSSQKEIEGKDGEAITEDIDVKSASGDLEQKSGIEQSPEEAEKSGHIEEKKAPVDESSDKSGQVQNNEKSGAVPEVSLESKNAEVQSRESSAPVESHSIEDAPESRSGADFLPAHRRMLSDPIIDAKGRTSAFVSMLSRPLSKNLGALDEIGSRSAQPVNVISQPLHNPGIFYRPGMMTLNNPPNQFFNKIPNHSYNPMPPPFRNQANDVSMSPISNAYPYVPPSQLAQKPFDMFSKLQAASENPKPLLTNNFYKPYDSGYNNFDSFSFVRTRRFTSPEKNHLPGFSNNNFY